MCDRDLLNLFEKAVKITNLLEEISKLELSLSDIPDLKRYGENLKKMRDIEDTKNNIQQSIFGISDKKEIKYTLKNLEKDRSETNILLTSKPSLIWKANKIESFCKKYDLCISKSSEFIDIEAMKILNLEKEKQTELRFILSGHSLEYMREEVYKMLRNNLA